MFRKQNIPNLLTMVRLICVPIIILMMCLQIFQVIDTTILIGTDFTLPILLLVSGLIFIFASFTDWLDGYIARKYNYVSTFGKFFDPIADKLLINSVLILFIPLNILPFWITLILILRDTIVDFIRMILSAKQITLAAGLFGKLKTVFQMIGLTILFFVSDWVIDPTSTNDRIIQQVILIPMYIAIIFSVYSGIVYFVQAKPNIL